MSSWRELPYPSRRGRSEELLPAASQDSCGGRGGEIPVFILPLKRPWANGIPSQFIHPQIGSEGQSSFATGVKMKGGAIWTVSGIQLVSRMWAEKSLSSNATPTLHLQQCSMTLSDSFRDAGLPQHTTLGLQWWGGQVLNAHICAFIRLSLYMSWLAFNLPGHCIGLGLYTSFYGWTN